MTAALRSIPITTAKPVSFQNPKQPIGNVSLVAIENGPPIGIRPHTPADGDNQHVAIKFEDLEQTALKQQNPTLHLCLSKSDTSRLIYSLIAALHHAGDRIATRLQQFALATVGEKQPVEAQCELTKIDLGIVNPYLQCSLKWPLTPVYRKSDEIRYNMLQVPSISLGGTFREIQQRMQQLVFELRRLALSLGLVLQIKDDSHLLKDDINWERILQDCLSKVPYSPEHQVDLRTEPVRCVADHRCMVPDLDCHLSCHLPGAEERKAAYDAQQAMRASGWKKEAGGLVVRS